MKILKINQVKMPFYIKGILLLALAVVFSSCESTNPVDPENPITMDIMEIVDESADVSTLKTAIDVADLRTTLQGEGPFTVFAPADAAFQALLDTDPSWNTIDDIPLATLTAVLEHHVVAARVFSTDLVSGTVATLNGNITIDAENLRITDASGATANIASPVNVLATNGVIHVIDKVLLP